MASTIIVLIITMILGTITFFAIGNFVLENSWRILIVLTVMVTSYTLVNEAFQSQRMD